MAYNQDGYGQQGQQGYGQYNPYGQSGNSYDAPQGNPYGQPQQPAYGHQGNYTERPDLEHHASSHYDEENATGGNNYEMSNMNGRDPNRILNEVRNIDGQIDSLDQDLQRLRVLQRQYLADPNAGPQSPLALQVNQASTQIMDTYRALVRRVKTIRQDPEATNARNKAQVGKVDRRLKSAINQCQQVDRDYRQDSREQIVRQYRIVRPDASDAEVQEVVEDTGNTQIFSQALISGDRRGDVQLVSKNVTARHKAIAQIEKDMVELAQLFNDLETLVVQQEPAVTQIEEKGQEATGHVAQANTELDVAVKKARSARRKKWYCAGIALLIIIIIVIIVVVVVKVTQR